MGHRTMLVLLSLVLVCACIEVKKSESGGITPTTVKKTMSTSTSSTLTTVVAETCYDGVRNQRESGVDCGGPCDPCPSCYDGVRNQNEIGIDCGGVCRPCNALCSKNSDCGERHYSETYCLDGNVTRDVIKYECLSPGWDNASCRIVREPELARKCINTETCMVAKFCEYAECETEARCIKNWLVDSWRIKD